MAAPSFRERFEARVDQAVPVATCAGVVAAILITLFADVPSPLPGIALESEALFYIERGVAVLAATVVVLMLVVHGLKQEVPSEATTTGVSYPLKQAVSSSEAAVDVLAERVDKLEEVRKAQVQGMELLHQLIVQVDKKIDGLQESIR